MGSYSDSRKLMVLLDLISIDQDKEKLSDIAREVIQQTKEYQVLKNLDQFYFISEQAHELKEKLLQINFDKKSVKEIYKEYDRLKDLIDNDLTFFIKNTKEKFAGNQYDIDLLPKESFNGIELQAEEDLTAKLVSILVKSGEMLPVHAFRKYLIRKTDDDVQQEYVKLRDPELIEKDQKRQKIFSIVGFLIGFILFPFILLPFYEQPAFFTVIGILFGLTFIYGFINSKPYFRFFNSLALLMTALTILIFIVLQTVNGLPFDMNQTDLLKIPFIEISACFGGLAGILLSRIVNKLPKDSFENPKMLTYFYQNKYVITGLLIVLTFLSITAFSAKQSVPMLVAETSQNVSQSVSNGITGTYKSITSKLSSTFESASDGFKSVFGRKQDNEETGALGTIQVTMESVNVRTGPSIDADVFTVVHQSDTYLYYGSQVDDEGREWFQLKNSETDEDLWISSYTVEIIE